MDIEIRRNMDLTWTIKGPSREDLEKAGIIPKLTEEQRRMLDEGARIRRELEEKIWSHFDKNEILDLLGDMITRETHESLHIANFVGEWLGFLPKKASEDEPQAYLVQWISNCIDMVMKGHPEKMKGVKVE